MSIDKKYQVFVSSTYLDLQEERREVMQALLELDCIPSGMELFPAATESQRKVIQRVIDDCDYYVVIVGGRYGSVGDDGLSYTQMEYEYAGSKGVPRLAFLHDNPSLIPAGKTEPDASLRTKLDAFREICRKQMCKTWNSPSDLGGKVSRSMVALKRDHPGIGWVRGDKIPDESAAETINRLRTENDRLAKKLARMQTEPPPGAGQIAQGKELVVFQFLTEVLTDGERYSQHAEQEFTWDELFAVLGPVMLQGATESQLMSATSATISRRLGYPQTMSISLISEEFRRIVVQFCALGYIKKAPRGNEKSSNPRWILTPYGEAYLMSVAAVRRSNSLENPSAQ